MKIILSQVDLDNALQKHQALRVQMESITQVPVELAQYLPIGSKIVKLRSLSDIDVYLPANQIDSYVNHIPTNIKQLRLIVLPLLKIPISDNRFAYICSRRAYLEAKNQPYLERLKTHTVIATIKGFNEYSALLRYNGLTLTLTNNDFSNHGDTKVSDVLGLNDYLPVVFSKMKKNNRVIRVKPKIPFPHPDYLKLYHLTDFKENHEYLAKIIKTTPKNIIVMLGKNDDATKSNSGQPIGPDAVIAGSARHPKGVIDDIAVPGQIVKVKIYKQMKPMLLVDITEVVSDYHEDCRTKYLQLLTSYRKDNIIKEEK